MISFRTDNYEFMTFNPKRLDHIKAKCYLRTDLDVRKFLNDSVELFLTPNKDEVLTDTAYLVARDDKICGYIALFDYRKYIEMHYAVISSYRGFKFSLKETTGASILKEASNKIFEIAPAIEFLKLDINENNINSKRAALSAGYELVGKVCDMEEYHKMRGAR